MAPRARLCVLVVSALAFSTVALAGTGSSCPPLVNWSAPPTYTPSTSSSRIRALADVTNPIPFIGVAPCRIVDTRGPTGTFGGPSLPASTPRNFPLPAGPCAGIPTSVSAYSLNITVTNTLGPGFISIYPQGGPAPLVSTLNYVAGQTIANAAIVPAGTAGGITAVAGVSGTDLIIDINGYYASTPATSSNTFQVVNSGPYAILGQTDSSSFGTAAVYGRATATTGTTFGVWGENFSTSTNGIGVYGLSRATTGQTYGVFGKTFSSGDGASAVHGEALGTTGLIYGVDGFEASMGLNSAGVRGVDWGGPLAGVIALSAGVRGESNFAVGVLGISQNVGVVGRRLNSSGTILSSGLLGYTSGVYFENGLAGTGTKNFVEPHPTDATKLIKYVSIEGREAGVYFRGRGQAHKGLATIDVPEDFRMVASEEGLSIQVTPIGEMANVAVTQIDLNRIAIKTSRDVEFFYTVNGVRRAYPTWNPIQENREEFVPEGPDAKLPAYLSANETQRLIDNGTYNADGTVNMETAERVGWAKAWADREAQAQAAAAEAQKAARARLR